ncbi:MAG TPA: hypothetical protein VKX49_32640 [Bryobacteraceae bacterium]|nr:hypothetical protein [Bryobacteraceae bacterium]HLI63965.1 hypothetical protein [Terriglobales bacterium]
MKKPVEQQSEDDLLPEYDFASMASGVRGKYYERYRKGPNIVRVVPNSRSFDSAPARPQTTRPGKARGRSAQDDKA